MLVPLANDRLPIDGGDARVMLPNLTGAGVLAADEVGDLMSGEIGVVMLE